MTQRLIPAILILVLLACEDKVDLQANGKATDYMLKVTPQTPGAKATTYNLKKVVPMVLPGDGYATFVLRGTDSGGAEVTFSGRVGESTWYLLNLVIVTNGKELYMRECDFGSNATVHGTDSGGKFISIVGSICMIDRKEGSIGPGTGYIIELTPFKLYFHKP